MKTEREKFNIKKLPAALRAAVSGRENKAKIFFFICAAFSVFAVFSIILYILAAGIPAFREIGFFKFIFGTLWAPDKDFLPAGERFGILPMIAGSLCVTAGAVLLGGTAGVFSAVFITRFCPKKLKAPFSHTINFLAGIPSIVYGFFGMVVVVPFLARISPGGSGEGLAACVLILGLMIVPTVTSISKDALEAVPKSYAEGALALGATKQQALFRTELRAAKSGITTAVILGAGRAVGETMAVLMVAGNAALFPSGLFSNIRTLTINMAFEMGYATGLHKTALIATGVVLLVFILLLNGALGLLKREKKEKTLFKTLRLKIFGEKKEKAPPPPSGAPPEFKKCGRPETALKYASAAFSGVVAAVLVFITLFVLIKGLPNLSFNLLFGESGKGNKTLGPAFISTGWLILIALAAALPLGVGGAIYLTEYSKKNGPVVKTIRLFTQLLSGIPSIVFGFFGMMIFCEFMRMGYSLIAGGLTLSLIILPTVIRSTEESLLAVQDSLRAGSYALGAGKLKTIFKIVLPSALPGVVTSVILAIGRIVGESAALIYTAGTLAAAPLSPADSGASFSVMMYVFSKEGLYMNAAYATAATLLIFTALLNVAVNLINAKLSRKITGGTAGGKTRAPFWKRSKKLKEAKDA